MSQPNPFDHIPAGSAQPAQPAPQSGPTLRPVLSLPDPQQDRDNNRDDFDRSRAIENDRLDRIDVFRKEFLGSEQAKSFREVAGATRQIAALANTETETPGPRDIALIISYMKALDPGSVVREGEFATAENAGGVPAKIRNLYNNVVDGGKLPPEVREEFVRTAVSIYDSKRASFDEFANTYRGLIEEYGGDPDKQGIRLSSPIEFGKQEDGFVPPVVQETGLTDPETVSGVPRGTEAALAIDKWGNDGAFDREAYLADQYGIGPNEEAVITAFWNQNASNPNLTVENVKQWYAGKGFDAPTDDAIAQTIETARSGQTFSGLDTTAAEADYLRMLDDAIAAKGYNPEEISDTVGVGAAQGLMIGGLDEATGLIGATGALIDGENPIPAYQAERDIVRRQLERSSEANPGTALVSEIGGSLVTGGAGARNAVANSGSRAAQAAREGAKFGGAAGFNYGEGAEDSLVSGAVGIPLGAALGVAGDKVAGAIQRRAASRPAKSNAGREVIEAADRFNATTGAKVEPLPADVGGATIRRSTGGAAQTTFGAKPIVDASARMSDEAQSGIRTIAGNQGRVPASKQEAGEITIAGAQKAMARDKLKVDAKYAKARNLAGGQRVELPTVKQQMTQEIAEMRDTPGGADGIKYFEELIGGIDGDWPVDGVKRFRAQVRDKLMKDGLRGSEVEARAMRIVDAADYDIEQGLIAAGKPEAAQAYADASRAASERFQMIDEVMTPILGKKGEKSGEQVFQAVERMSKGDAVALGEFMKALPSEEAGSIRAVIIDRLGRATKGRQDADGQAFSLNDFLTRWNDEGMSPQAKAVLFDGETRAALDDLARVAQGTKEGQRYANFSNTAGGNAFNALINGGPLGIALFEPMTAAAVGASAVGSQAISGRLLASPKLARWLAKMPKQKTEKAVEAHVSRLEKVAAADSAISAEVLGLQRSLMGAFETGPQRLAADPGERNEASNTTAQVPQ